VYAGTDRWAEIRRRVLTGETSKREACRLYDIRWLTLTKILPHEEPPGYRRVAPPRRPTVAPVLPVIRQILDDDAKAPTKQRHTARRIWERRKTPSVAVVRPRSGARTGPGSAPLGLLPG
jgi:hypothetical protein